MSIPRYCEDCNNILELVNLITGTMACKTCDRNQNLPDNDKVVVISYFNDNSVNISDTEVTRLMYEPTTMKKRIKCRKCDNDIMSIIKDDNYNYIQACRKCKSIFRNY